MHRLLSFVMGVALAAALEGAASGRDILARTTTIYCSTHAFWTSAVSPQVRKVPLMREPWEHFIGAGVCAYLGNELVKYTERTEKEIEELLQKREAMNKGFRVPSMAGSTK